MPRHACENGDTQPIRDTAIIPDPYPRRTRILQYCACALAAALVTLAIVGTVGYLGTPKTQSFSTPTVTIPDPPMDTSTPEATTPDAPTEVPEVPAEIPSTAPPAKLPLAQPTPAPSAPVIIVPVPTQVVTPVPELTPDPLPEPTLTPPVEDNPKPRHHARQTVRNNPPAPLQINLGNLLP